MQLLHDEMQSAYRGDKLLVNILLRISSLNLRLTGIAVLPMYMLVPSKLLILSIATIYDFCTFRKRAAGSKDSIFFSVE